ncbi:hypothetical protein [Nocardia alni]|uniref:hypothetical protein n=1 Tax=Nocardia alni TaxID=2815723 RepID=UPI001C22F228|nr:hypothetical protein [Nocardia alni]
MIRFDLRAIGSKEFDGFCVTVFRHPTSDQLRVLVWDYDGDRRPDVSLVDVQRAREILEGG